jgi:hypothetical protein
MIAFRYVFFKKSTFCILLRDKLDKYLKKAKKLTTANLFDAVCGFVKGGNLPERPGGIPAAVFCRQASSRSANRTGAWVLCC